MATIIIRNLDDLVAERLRRRAWLNGVSVEEEAQLTRAEIATRAATIRASQKSNAVDLIREDRER